MIICFILVIVLLILNISLIITDFQRCKIPKIEHRSLDLDCKPLDTHFIFNSTDELEDYIRSGGKWAKIGQIVLIDRDVYSITKIGSNPEYHKLQTEDKIKI